MRQIFLLVSILLLGLTWAIAQDTPSQTSPSTSSGQSSAGSGHSGQMSRSSSGGETTVQGCLSGSSGNYTLSDKNGNTYQLTGDTAKLSQHVGHEVKVMGTMGSGAGTTGAEGSAGTAGSAGATAGTAGAAGAQQTLQVTSVKHVSKSCQAGSGMSH